MDSVMPECRHCSHYAFLPPARPVLSCPRLRHIGENPITWPITILRSAHYTQSLPFQGKKCLPTGRSRFWVSCLSRAGVFSFPIQCERHIASIKIWVLYYSTIRLTISWAAPPNEARHRRFSARWHNFSSVGQGVSSSDLLGLFPLLLKSPYSWTNVFISLIWFKIIHQLGNQKTSSFGVLSFNCLDDLLNTFAYFLVFNLFPSFQNIDVCRVLAICDFIEQKQY